MVNNQKDSTSSSNDDLSPDFLDSISTVGNAIELLAIAQADEYMQELSRQHQGAPIPGFYATEEIIRAQVDALGPDPKFTLQSDQEQAIYREAFRSRCALGWPIKSDGLDEGPTTSGSDKS